MNLFYEERFKKKKKGKESKYNMYNDRLTNLVEGSTGTTNCQNRIREGVCVYSEA